MQFGGLRQGESELTAITFGAVDVRAAVREKLSCIALCVPNLIPRITTLTQILEAIDKTQPMANVPLKSLGEPSNGFSALAYKIEDLRENGRCDLTSQLINNYLQLFDEYALLPFLKFFTADEVLKRAISAKGENNHTYDDALCRVEAILTFHQPCIIAVGGFSGSGKSSIARELVNTGMVHLATDVLRKKLQVAPLPEANTRYDSGLYARANRAFIYEQIYSRAKDILHSGYPVIVDATFLDPNERKTIQELARQECVPFYGFWCEATKELLKARVTKREAKKVDASDAGIMVLNRQLEKGTGEITWRKLNMCAPKADIINGIRPIINAHIDRFPY